MTDKPIHQHTFCFNPQDNGGESLTLTTKFIPNGDPCVFFTNQELTLQSYCNSASFNLYSVSITPESLRKLANELEEAELTINSMWRMDWAKKFGLTRYDGASKYGDGHPIGTYTMTMDLDTAQEFEKRFGLKTGNAPDGYDLAAIDIHPNNKDMSVWADYGDGSFISIEANWEDGYTMMVGPDRLDEVVDFLLLKNGVKVHS